MVEEEFGAAAGVAVPIATGHFYGMTTHARGGLFLAPSARAVLAETDVINMVSRGISTANIPRGIHESMAHRFARLRRSIGARGVVLVSGGLASDQGLLAALQDALDEDRQLGSELRVELLRTEVDWDDHELVAFFGRMGLAPVPRLVLEAELSR